MSPNQPPAFDAHAFLESVGLGKRTATYAPGDVLFSQGDPCDSVMYLRSGRIKLSVISHEGKEAILANVEPGDFLGEGGIAGHTVRLEMATALEASAVTVVARTEMIRLLHEERAFSDRFVAHMLTRNARLEADLVDQLFNSSEKRLARRLLLLARYGMGQEPLDLLPVISQEALAEMVGTTRSRVNVFLNKFRKLGFIEYDGRGIKVRPSLLTVVVHD